MTEMADDIVARDGGATFQSHPTGSFPARCVDLVDMGYKYEVYPGQQPKVTQKAVVVWRTGEKNDAGQFIDVGREFTVSMSEKGNLRPFLEGWRGKHFTQDDIDAGVSLTKLVGVPAYIQVIHKLSAKQRTYAFVQQAMPLPKGMQAPDGDGYERAPFYAERKKAYAEELAKMRPGFCPPDFITAEPAALDDDEIPF